MSYDLYHGAGTEAALTRLTTDPQAYQPQSGGEIDWTDGIYLTSEPDQAMSWSQERAGGGKEFYKVASLDLPHEEYGAMTTLLFQPTLEDHWQWDGAIQGEEVCEDGYKYICRSVHAMKMFVSACRSKTRPPAIPLDDAFDGSKVFDSWENLDAVEAPIWPSEDYEPGTGGPFGHQIFFARTSNVLDKFVSREVTDLRA